MLSESRNKKLKDLARRRQFDLTLILENVHDPHNIGAVMRTCDAVGISEIYAIYTQDSRNARKEYVGEKASRGTKKWVTCHFYHSIEECMKAVAPKFDNILATHLATDSKSIYETDLTISTAMVFGNEHEGISKELLGYCTGNILIPMVGMVQSLNISVAAALSMYEAFRQRMAIGAYDRPFDFDDLQMRNIYRHGVAETYPRIYESDPKKIDEVVLQKGRKLE